MIENYTTWEKVIETFIVNERFSAVKKFVERIIESIEAIKEEDAEHMPVKSTLYFYLHSCLCRSFALVWKEKSSETIKKIYNKMTPVIKETFEADETELALRDKRLDYCRKIIICVLIMICMKIVVCVWKKAMLQ